MIKHLSLLSILHYVYGAIICFFGVVALLMMGLGAFVLQSGAAQEMDPAMPQWFGAFIASFGLGLFLVLMVWGILIILSGVWISKRRNRTASIIIAALCLLNFPLGTALGVFTLVALSDDEVKAEYATLRSLAARG
jgi:succinate dehydrogenase/fumarate reductase cytochrome b subunit